MNNFYRFQHSFSTLNILIAIIFILLSSSFGQVTNPQPTKEKYQAMLLKQSREEISHLKKRINENPKEEDILRQEIVRRLIWINAPTKEILKTVGNGFQNPRKKLYFEIASLLEIRGEELETALRFLELENKVIYFYIPNDAYIPPCIWCVESGIRFQRNEYEKVIELLEVRVENIDRLYQSYSNNDLYFRDTSLLKFLGLSYFRVGRIDAAINLYLRVVSETVEAKSDDERLLNEFYLKKYGNLNGLKEKISAKNKQSKYAFFIKPHLSNISSPQWTLKDIAGKEVSLSDFSGKIVVILFIVSQFSRERRNITEIQEIIGNIKDIVFVAIDEGYPHPSVKRREIINIALAGINVNFPILLGTQMEISQSYKAYENFTVLIDKNSKIRFNTGFSKPRFTEQIQCLLNEKENE